MPAEFGGAADWRNAFGNLWYVDLLVVGAVLVVLGWIIPLTDPDLPQHLSNGEWIVRNGTWPTVEPFAWTRAGDPYFAYSHLPQVLYYSVLSWFGPAGLRFLNGLLLMFAGAAVLVLGRYAGWRPWVSLSIAAYNVLIVAFVVPALRPQTFLLVAVPLCWAFAYAILRQRSVWAPMLALLLSSALAANSHLFFPITVAPLLLCLIKWPRQSWRVAAIAVPIVLGWLLSPYGFRWHEVFALNFGANPLLDKPSPIREFTPGFTLINLSTIAILPLLLLPWGVPSRTAFREKVLLAGAWLVGLVAFGYAVRLVLAWWLVCLPLAGLVVTSLMRQLQVAPPRPQVRYASYAMLLVYCVAAFFTSGAPSGWSREGDVHSRRLPSLAHEPVEPLVEWLECRAVAGGKVFTWFNYGSYLTWRMPGYSMSIDGRTIFPDSVALAEILIGAKRPPPTLGPWASADLALLPVNFRVASVLDTASGWRRVAENPATTERVAIGLWVKESWWTGVSDFTLPASAVAVTQAQGSDVQCSPATEQMAGKEFTPSGAATVPFPGS